MADNIMPEIKEFFNLLDKKTKMAAMLAPSFPVDFSYPDIVGMLKRLGFKYVAEVARGATETNRQLLALLKLHPDKKYIANPCPTIVRLVRNKYHKLVPFLTPIDSPMAATAKIVSKKYPNHKKVFIGPCILKKLEAKEDYPKLDILVLTYKELKKIFEIKKIVPQKSDKSASFDITGKQTRLYSVSGGLAQSSCLTKNLTDPEYDVISGPRLTEKTLQNFPTEINLKLLDILSCEGGCINGPGVVSKDSLNKRRQKVIAYWKKG
ncbi:MAG TPA: [Fe-Fe] hydrogenase large subunit C-terminal domain-containing protein [Candidatus Paceibacterota bacterium]|nr:[Fe-Fe] hydrogenase large subunit C-terminal domain-containing protein [Candidatus Paceibacterota bacterium]